MPKLSVQAKKMLPASLAVTFLIVCLIINPQKYIASVYNGMVIFVTNVAPAMLPFFFFTKLLTGMGTAELLGNALRRPTSYLYNTDGSSGYVYFMSIISGYPVGSKLIADLYDGGVIDDVNARKMSTFTSTSGPLFIVGTVGAMMFASPKLGYVAMLCHFAAALLNGLIYRGKRRSAPSAPRAPIRTDRDDLLGESMSSSITSLLIVGGYIAIFSMVIDVLKDVGLIGLLAAPLSKLLELCHQPPQLAEGIIMSTIELTRGCLELSKCGVEIPLVLPYVAALLSFGGLSICMQSLTFLSHCKVKASFFLLSKLTHAAITFVITYLICLLL